MPRTSLLFPLWLVSLAAARSGASSRRPPRTRGPPHRARIPWSHRDAPLPLHVSAESDRKRPIQGCRVWEQLRGGSSYHDEYDRRAPPRGSSGSYYGDDGAAPRGSAAGSTGEQDRYGRAADGEPWSRDSRQEDRDGYYAYEYEEEYERRRQSQVGSSGDASAPSPSLLAFLVPSVLQTGDRRLGLILLGAGTVVTMLGISLFFNKTLMRLGNLLVIAGVPVTLGPSRVAGYFIQPQKARATACLGLGIFLVLVGWPVFGIALEVFGLLNLFGNLFPVVMAVAKQVPLVGAILNAGGGQSRSNDYGSGQRRRDRYYEDEEDYYYEGQERDQRRRDEDDRYQY